MRMSRPPILMGALLVLLLPLLAMRAFAVAPEPAPASALTYVGEQEGLYRYQLPGGTGFFSTVRQGEQNAPMAAFRMDDGLSYTLLLEGEPVEYFSEVLLTAPGSYQLLVTDIERGEADIFIFSVAPESEGDSQPFQFGKVVHNAPMTPGYDEASAMFSYTFPNGASYHASLPSGGITTEALSVVFSEGIKATLFYNDNLLPYASGDPLTREGIYRLQLVQSPRFSPDAEDSNTYVTTYYARILQRSDSHLELLYPPVGFIWSQVTCEEEPVVAKDPAGALHLARDGLYQLTLESTFAPGLQYHLTLHKDTQPPLIVFSEGGLAGYSELPVCFAPYDDKTTITVMRNGMLQEGTNVLSESGTYQLTATDSAGNTRDYTVRIQLHNRLAVTPQILIFLVPLLVAAAAVMLWAHRQTRVI